MEKEIWKDVKGFEGLYQVSNLGRIKSLQFYVRGMYIKREKILKPCDNGNGYKIIYLMKNKKRNVRYIHRLVAIAFIKNPKNYKCINHKDENKKNNCVENLEWCTHKYNNNYGNHKSKISKSRMKRVIQYDKNMNLIKIWDGVRLAMKEMKSYHICSCCKGKIKYSGGYIWRYEK